MIVYRRRPRAGPRINKITCQNIYLSVTVFINQMCASKSRFVPKVSETSFKNCCRTYHAIKNVSRIMFSLSLNRSTTINV